MILRRVFLMAVCMTVMPAFGAETVAVKASAEAVVPAMRAAKPADLSRLKKLDAKYKKAKSISMEMQKTVKEALLGQEKKSTGHILLSQGRMRMEVDPPNHSLVVINKKDLWIVNYPSEEFKDAAIQAMRMNANTKKGEGQNFLGLLMGGGFSKYFKVVSVTEQTPGEVTYFLSPSKQSFDVTRAQLTLDQDGKNIKGLRYWDEKNNETYFEFNNVETGKAVVADKFQYIPPKGAEVSTM